MTKYAQPSDELEAENAAYVWYRECQTELVDAARQTDAEFFERIVFAFERFRRAVEKHHALESRRVENNRTAAKVPPPSK